MDIVMKNYTIFETLKQTYPELNAFFINKGFLIYRDKKLDLSKFDLEVLINEDFINSFKGKNPEEIYKIFEEKLTPPKKLSNKEKLKNIVMENPTMRNITIFNNEDLVSHTKEEFINIRVSSGENYLFKNDGNFDIFNFYYGLERVYGDNITPDIIAQEINKWHMNKLEVISSDAVMEKEDCKESFKNKLREIKEQYKDKTEINIEANIEEEIIYINNINEPDKNIIITFEYDINNELVMRVHKTNVKQEKTVNNVEDIDKNDEEDVITANQISNSNVLNSNMNYTNTSSTISKKDLFDIISKDGPYSNQELEQVNNYFKDIENMIKNNIAGYESIMEELNNYVEQLQISKNVFSEREDDFMKRCYKLYDELEMKKGNSKGSQLTLKTDAAKYTQVDSDENNSYGFSSPAAIIIMIASIVVVLSIIVLSLF